MGKKYICRECGKTVDEKKTCIVDGKAVCVGCMYDGSEPFEIYPIGVVRSGLRRAESGFGTEGEKGMSVIELFKSQEPFMYRIEEEECLTVIYYLHEAGQVRSVFERGYDGKRTGVFATRTPDRLSRIAIQDVKLVKVEGTTLYVEGLDAVDGSPVLDIKMKWSPCP
jgi:tRNA (Thr-GGU) A37 N-methylase